MNTTHIGSMKIGNSVSTWPCVISVRNAGNAVPAPPSAAHKKPMTNRLANPYSTVGVCEEWE